jgi:hypothetical protein
MTKRATATKTPPRAGQAKRICAECGSRIEPQEMAPVLILSGTPFLRRRLSYFHKRCR